MTEQAFTIPGRRTATVIFALICGVFVAGCTDSAPVRNLAIEAGDVSVGLAKSMSDLKSDSVVRSRRRAAYSARLAAVTHDNSVRFQQLKEEIAAYGGAEEKKVMRDLADLMAIAKKGMPTEINVAAVAESEETRLIGTLGVLNDQSKELNALAEGLYALGKERGARDQFKFLFAYAKELKSDIDDKREALKEADESN